MATLGIDFGTSYTFIVKKDGDKIEPYGQQRLYEGNTNLNNLLCGSPGIKTVIGYVADSNVWVVGQDVYEYVTDERNICSQLKTRVRDIIFHTNQTFVSSKGATNYIYDFDLLKNNKDYQTEDFGHWFFDKNGEKFYKDAIELSVMFFKKVLKDGYSDEEFLKGIQYIVFGMPAHELNEVSSGTDYKNEAIDKIFNSIVKDIPECKIKHTVRPEPVLAGAAYTNILPDWATIGDNILVIDIGGGTSDFAFVQRVDSDDNFMLPVSAKGGTAPAGRDFDNAVIATVKNPITNSNATFVKESMFLTRSDFLKEHMELQTKSDSEIDQAYDDYCNHGRHISITENGQEYFIAFDENNSAKNSSTCFYAEKFYDVCERLNKQINGYISDSRNIQQYSAILFVGGTSNSDKLRDSVLSALEISEKNGRYYDSKGKTINVVFFATADNAIDKVQLTSSNAIAIGGAVIAEKIFNRKIHQGTESSVSNSVPRSVGISVPDIKIKVKGDSQELLILSHAYKTYGKDSRIEKDYTWPPRYYYHPEEEKVEFQIISDGVYYPSGKKESDESKPYWFKLPKHDKNIMVVFLADVNYDEELAIFCCVVDTNFTSRTKIVESYKIETTSGNSPEYKFDDGMKANRNNCRKYSVSLNPTRNGKSVNLNSPSDSKPFSTKASKKRKYSIISSLRQDDGFGWNLKK